MCSVSMVFGVREERYPIVQGLGQVGSVCVVSGVCMEKCDKKSVWKGWWSYGTVFDCVRLMSGVGD